MLSRSFANIRTQWEKIHLVLWAGLIILLPLTSVPWVVKLLHSDSIGAPSGLILGLLLILWFLPLMFKKGSIPKQSIPLIGFTLVSIIATAAASFLPITPYRSIDFLGHEIQSGLTLLVGLLFFLISARFPTKPGYIRLTLHIINISGFILILWSLTQAFTWNPKLGYPIWLKTIQKLISTGGLFGNRVTGLAMEPSWLAHQLNMLYVPLWLAFSVKRDSLYRVRILKIITLENILLIGGIVVLWLTLSRMMILAFLLMCGYLFIRLNLYLNKWSQEKIVQRFSIAERKGRIILSVGLWLTMIILYLAIFFSLLYGLSRIDKRMAQTFTFDFRQENPILRYAQELDFGPRMVYWIAGWETFNDYPWLGVGLGNSGYFFQQKLPPFAWGLIEVRNVMYRATYLINCKSLWVRLLAETGIIGFSFFCSWLYLMWRSARLLENHPNSLNRIIGLTGIFVLLGLVAEGFSVDSFALPYLWISMGLVTATLGSTMLEKKSP